jgi:hypothetical protein
MRVQASPFARRLAEASSRIEFVILRTGRSPPVAPHPASRRRSYFRLQAGERLPEEDSHLSDTARSQAHEREHLAPDVECVGREAPPPAGRVRMSEKAVGKRELIRL